MQVDDQIIALFRQGTPAAVKQANDLVTGREIELFSQMAGAIAGVVEQVDKDANAAQSDASSTKGTATMLMLVVALLALAMAVALALLITRSVTRPLARLSKATETAATGDLTVEAGLAQRDEIGQVGGAFDRMIRAMREMVGVVAKGARDLARMSEEMSVSSEQSGNAVAEIASTVDAVARGSGEQAEQVQQVTEIVGHMTDGVAQMSGYGQQAVSRAEDADRVAEEGAGRAEEATQAMARISESTEGVQQVVNALEERSQAIGQIVGAITEIAEQTNLLALNAAIEAARAGDQGRGFAVVADEVRKLAEESQQAAGSIRTILSEIQGESRRAVQAMAQGREDVAAGAERVRAAGEAFGLIRDQVRDLVDQIARSAAATAELEAGAGQVQDRISSVAAVSQENAAAAEEVASATEETTASVQQVVATTHQLSEQARALQQLVERFTV